MVQSKKYSELCLAATKNSKIKNISQYGYITVTSNLASKGSNPYSVINESDGVFWGPV